MVGVPAEQEDESLHIAASDAVAVDVSGDVGVLDLWSELAAHVRYPSI